MVLAGVTVRLVVGTTLHTLFKLTVEKGGQIVGNWAPLTGKYLKVLRNQWRDIEFLSIDEICMVPYEMLCMINFIVRQLKEKESEPFGGVNTRVLGDLFHLPPIRGSTRKIRSDNSFVETPQSC
ncbi:ATP-dependent DNA helicase [Trichonephila clavipes]|uniref:ATP-dependent DNA helicase n=1 Tax=Trichonephila clavipes TaxID=2585209 RepID=A0A8X6R7W2_TRICX|nr:ATP-dependent DNA helicase [Trichonephila clavipes]